MNHRLWVTGLAIVTLAACGSGDSKGDSKSGAGDPGVDQSKPLLQGDGPLHGIAMAARAPAGVSPVAPSLLFTTEHTEATAVVGLGPDVPEDGTLTVAWYRLAGPDRREYLFSHRITVGPGGRALSQGVSATGLAPGMYETVATLEAWQVRTPWIVRAASTAAAARGEVEPGNAVLVSARVAAPPDDEPWNVPESGESSWWQEPAAGELSPARPPPDPERCTLNDISGGMDPMIDVSAHVTWLGKCPERTLAATVSGTPQTLASLEATETPYSLMYGEVNVCELPGGSDLPGTVVRFTATGGADGPQTSEYPLPDYGEFLVAGVESSPSAARASSPVTRSSYMPLPCSSLRRRA